ncbi:MAG: acyl carrier protein [Terriglobales bacterium]
MLTHNILALVVAGCLIAVVGALIWMGFLSIFGIAWKKRTRLAHRRSLRPTEFYRSFYANSGIPREVVIRLVKEIAEATEFPEGLIRPEDRFSKELAPLRGWDYMDDGSAELLGRIRRHEKELGITVDVETLRTVDDYMTTFGKKVS